MIVVSICQDADFDEGGANVSLDASTCHFVQDQIWPMSIVAHPAASVRNRIGGAIVSDTSGMNVSPAAMCFPRHGRPVPWLSGGIS
jgi:hypothetical protein